jgi:hypothetical protein
MTRFSLAVAAVVCGTWVAAGEPPPARDGLRVWLDASAEGTLEIGENGRLVRWRNRVEGGPAAEAEVGRGPVPVADAMNGKPVLRFTGAEWLRLPALRPSVGPVAVFVVAQRREGQAFEPTVFDVVRNDVGLYPIWLGRNGRHEGQNLHGDVAELLVYDRAFVSEDAIQQVLRYLGRKWNAHVLRRDQGWTLVGPLPDPPKRITDRWPLSDQANRDGWQPDPDLTDEFTGDQLDEAEMVADQSQMARTPTRPVPSVQRPGGGRRVAVDHAALVSRRRAHGARLPHLYQRRGAEPPAGSVRLLRGRGPTDALARVERFLVLRSHPGDLDGDRRVRDRRRCARPPAPLPHECPCVPYPRGASPLERRRHVGSALGSGRRLPCLRLAMGPRRTEILRRWGSRPADAQHPLAPAADAESGQRDHAQLVRSASRRGSTLDVPHPLRARLETPG